MSELAGTVTARVGGGEAHMQSFEEAWAEHAPAVVRFIAKKVSWDKELSSELVQDTAVKAFRAWTGGHPPHTNTGAWFRSTAQSVFNDYLRKRTRRQGEGSVGGGELPDDTAAAIDIDQERVELREVLHPCLLALDERSRGIVTAHYEEDRRIADISTELGLTEGVVRGLLWRARGNLKRCLARRGYGNG